MCTYVRSIFKDIAQSSRVFIFIPSYFTVALFQQQYDLLFNFLVSKIGYPTVVYRDWYYTRGVVRQLFFEHPNNIIRCDDSLSYHIKTNDYKSAIFCWEYRHIATYLKEAFGFDIPDIRDGGCYFLHLPENDNPDLKIIHRLDWNGVEKILQEELCTKR